MMYNISTIMAQDPSRLSKSTDDMEELFKILRLGALYYDIYYAYLPGNIAKKAIHYISTNQGGGGAKCTALNFVKG